MNDDSSPPVGGYPSAKALLDAVRSGAQVRADLILRALILTGDVSSPNELERAIRRTLQ